jgi:hypothetical protein
MFSIRKKTRMALGLAATSALAGCFHHPERKTDPVSTEPLAIDEAMQRREWPRQVSEYYGGGVVAGATRFPYVPAKTGEGADRAVFGPERSNSVLDTGAFLAQAYMLPFTYLIDYPFVKKTYHGVTMEPGYTLMPVMPPDESPPREVASSVPAPVSTKTTTTTTTPEPAETESTGPGTVAPSETPPEAKPPVVVPEPKAESTEQPAPEPAAAEPKPDSKPADGANE